jgi:hypothetical protein
MQIQKLFLTTKPLCRQDGLQAAGTRDLGVLESTGDALSWYA